MFLIVWFRDHPPPVSTIQTQLATATGSQEGAQVNHVDNEGRSALLWAAIHGSAPWPAMGSRVVRG